MALSRDPAGAPTALDAQDRCTVDPAAGPKLRHLVLFVLLQLAIMAASLAALWPVLSGLFG